MSEDDITIGGLKSDIKNMSKSIDEIKGSIDKLIDGRDNYIKKDDYEKDQTRIHQRITDECVSKSELKAIKVPLWVITAALLGGIGTWLANILTTTIEKLPAILKGGPPSP